MRAEFTAKFYFVFPLFCTVNFSFYFYFLSFICYCPSRYLLLNAVLVRSHSLALAHTRTQPIVATHSTQLVFQLLFRNLQILNVFYLAAHINAQRNALCSFHTLDFLCFVFRTFVFFFFLVPDSRWNFAGKTEFKIIIIFSTRRSS